MISKNKGEWSELYAMFRLLAQGKIFAADENLNKLDDIYFSIIKIIRETGSRDELEYEKSDDVIKILLNDKFIKDVPVSVFSNQADALLAEIKKGGERSFSIENTEHFMDEILCDRVTGASSQKTDIKMQIHDIQTGYSPVCGFSIKSELGSAPTLLNASGATNFIYEVIGLNNDDIETTNAIEDINKIQKRMNYIFSHGDMIFQRPANEMMESNLMMLDSKLPEIIAEALKIHYRDNISEVFNVVKALEFENPLNYPHGGFYEYKIRKFLCAVALGMMPSRRWSGKDDATGGYVIVTKDGNVLAYHIYNRDCFEEYLLNNTKFERGSTTRHGYASIYELDGTKYINLNLQIRFL